MFIFMGSDADYFEPAKIAVNLSPNGFYFQIVPLPFELLNLIGPFKFRRILQSHIMTNEKKAGFEKICSMFPECDGDYYFIFTFAWIDYIFAGLVEYIKKHFPNSKTVLYLLDISSQYGKSLDVNYFKKIFNCIVTFDYKDAERYGFYLYDKTIYTKLDLISNDTRKKTIENSDIYFCGAAKNRLPDILQAYEYFKENGLDCDFYITNVPEAEQKWEDEIHYNQIISYKENLQHVENTKCILEIMQQGGTGYTLRTREALVMDKKLITNNTYITMSDFYDASRFYAYHNIKDLNLNFLTKVSNPVSQITLEQMSADNFFQFLKEILNCNENKQN